MRSRLRLPAALSWLPILLASCAPDADGAMGAAAPVSANAAVEAVDTLGRTVRLTRPAARIAALSSGFTETLFAIGCGDRIVLRDRWSDYPPAAARLPETDGLHPSVSTIAGFRPDLTLIYSADGRQLAGFERIGLPVAAYDPRSYEDVAAYVEQLGALCGEPDRARQIAARMRETREAVVARTVGAPAPLVYAEVDASDPARPWTAGPGSFVDELIRLAGGRNVAAEVGAPYAQVNAEAIIRADPQVILRLDVARTGTEGPRPGAADGTFADRAGWSRVDAVVRGRVIDSIDGDILSRPGPRLADALVAVHAAISGQEAP